MFDLIASKLMVEYGQETAGLKGSIIESFQTAVRAVMGVFSRDDLISDWLSSVHSGTTGLPRRLNAAQRSGSTDATCQISIATLLL